MQNDVDSAALSADLEERKNHTGLYEDESVDRICSNVQNRYCPLSRPPVFRASRAASPTTRWRDATSESERGCDKSLADLERHPTLSQAQEEKHWRL